MLGAAIILKEGLAVIVDQALLIEWQLSYSILHARLLVFKTLL